MTLNSLVLELKEYLRIDALDMEENAYLSKFCESAAGYIASVYSYHILDTTLVSKQQYVASHPDKFYLPAGPAKDGTVNIKNPDGTNLATPFTLINNTVIFDTYLEYTAGAFTITFDVGVEHDEIEYYGDIEHCVQLAAWLYRSADKGLEGMEQISTGVKESARMFSGIPRNITAYFETRQVIRL
jgi:hypothetical protein